MSAPLIVGAIIVGLSLWRTYGPTGPAPSFNGDDEHFKYGSIGAEVNGYPYLIWRELPSLFADQMRDGWATFGFIQETGRELPVGISVRRYTIDRVGFNCATCHTSTVAGRPGVVLGAPANRLDLQRYLNFLVETRRDRRLTPDAVFASADAAGRPIGWLDKLVFRYFVFGRLRREIDATVESLAWMKSRPPQGPGRTDAGNPWRSRWGMAPESDNLVGTVDFPSLWNQRIRATVWMHWDGNNKSLAERNLSAALAGGATPDSLDHESIERVAAWAMDLPAPPYPATINAGLAERGRAVYASEGCGTCHDQGGPQFGEATPQVDVGTDPARLILLSEEMVRQFGRVGEGRAWQFRNYRVSDGYANAPLDGIWARAPYLHNGSVPTLDALLWPGHRPVVFLRGCDNFDWVTVGFVCSDGAIFDTRLPGNGNGGHLYGTRLNADDRRALIEYLKTI